MRHRSVAVMCALALVSQACLLFDPVNTQEQADAGQAVDAGSTTDVGTSRDTGEAPATPDAGASDVGGEADMGSCPPVNEACVTTSAAEPIVCGVRGEGFAPIRCFEDESGCIVAQELDCPFGSTCEEDALGGILSDVCLPCEDDPALAQECVGKDEVCIDGVHHLCEERQLGCAIASVSPCDPDFYCDDDTGSCRACDPDDPNPPAGCPTCASNECDNFADGTAVNCIPGVSNQIGVCMAGADGCLSVVVVDCPNNGVCEDSPTPTCTSCADRPDSCTPASDPFDPTNYRCDGTRVQRCLLDQDTSCHRWTDEEDCGSQGRYGGVCGDGGDVNPSTMSVLIRATCWENECEVGVSDDTCSMDARQVLGCVADRGTGLEYYNPILSCASGLVCTLGECVR